MNRFMNDHHFGSWESTNTQVAKALSETYAHHTTTNTYSVTDLLILWNIHSHILDYDQVYVHMFAAYDSNKTPGSLYGYDLNSTSTSVSLLEHSLFSQQK